MDGHFEYQRADRSRAHAIRRDAPDQYVSVRLRGRAIRATARSGSWRGRTAIAAVRTAVDGRESEAGMAGGGALYASGNEAAQRVLRSAVPVSEVRSGAHSGISIRRYGTCRRDVPA